MTGRRLHVVGGREAGSGAGAGDPALVALLEGLLFEARAGSLQGIIAVVERPGELDLVDHSPASDWELAGYLAWAQGEVVGRVVG